MHIWEPFGPNTLKKPPEQHGIGHIRGLHVTRTTSKHATDTAMNVSNCWAQIARFQKDFQLAVIVEYPLLHGSLVDGHVLEVVTNDEENTICMADGGASSIAILDNQQAQFAILVPYVGVAYQLIGDGVPKWKQTIFGIFELPVGISMGVTLD